MNIKNKIKLSIFGKFLIRQKRRIELNAKGYVFMLHRVADKDGDALSMNEDLKISPEFLESFIVANREKYDFISPMQIDLYFKKKNNRKFIIFTMDDGYLDNFTIAYEIFKKYEIPFTVFVATSFPNKEANLWWFEIEHLILENEQLTLSDGSSYFCRTKKEKNDVFFAIRQKLLSVSPFDIESEFKRLFSDYIFDFSETQNTLCVDWKKIEEVMNDPLFTLGAHTCHHYNLKALPTLEAVKEEVKAGLLDFEKNLGIVPKIFAYPFGSVNEVGKREVIAARELGFLYAFKSFGGGIKTLTNPTALPRIAFHEGFSFENYLDR